MEPQSQEERLVTALLQEANRLSGNPAVRLVLILTVCRQPATPFHLAAGEIAPFAFSAEGRRTRIGREVPGFRIVEFVRSMKDLTESGREVACLAEKLRQCHDVGQAGSEGGPVVKDARGVRPQPRQE